MPLSIPFKAFGNTVKACRGPYPVEAQGLRIFSVGFSQIALLFASVEWQAHGYASAVVDPDFKSLFNSRAACDLENLANGFRRPWLVQLPNGRRQNLSYFLIANFAAASFGKQLSRLLNPRLKRVRIDKTAIVGARNMRPLAKHVIGMNGCCLHAFSIFRRRRSSTPLSAAGKKINLIKPTKSSGAWPALGVKYGGAAGSSEASEYSSIVAEQ